MYQGQTLHLTRLDNQLVELCFDRKDEAVNKFDALTVEELRIACKTIRDSGDVHGLVLTSAKDSFIVGADIFEFTQLFARPESELAAYNLAQNRVFNELAQLPLPTVCAINGLALGGGFEVTLATDFRVLGNAAKVGLPEVGLGIIPGLGGTARLPRLIGSAASIDWITSGKPQTSAAAKQLGAVDEVVDDQAVRQCALAVLAEAVSGQRDWQALRRQRSLSFALDTEQSANAKAAVIARNPLVPAPLLAIELLERSAGLSLAEALNEENRTFAQVAQTQAAQALVQLFINDQYLRKKTRDYAKASRKLSRAAVLGAGIMGGGIAYTSAANGVLTIMKDISQAALDLGMAEAGKLLDKQVSNNRMTQFQAERVLESITPTLTYQGMDKVDVLVEAVVENLAVKKTVLAAVETQVAASTVLTSNTSSLSITEIASALQRPENFVGMHFFNPVPVMPLVEVICGPHTSEQSAATVASYAATLGKTPIVVKDCPGFLVNRILTANVLAFLRLIHDGADYQAVDQAMEAFGWPMGPAYLQDVIGMDTSRHVIDCISQGYGDRMLPGFTHAVELMVTEQRLGQKNGLGFYRYDRDIKGRLVKSVDPDTQALLTRVQPQGRREFSSEEIVERIMLPMLIEAARALEEGICESAIEIDMALILGVGFPRPVGGALKYADWLGLPALVARCDHYTALGGLYQVTPQMREMASNNLKFYS
ncbi:fatty acid oxidation complex subunit alpha FadB [Pseudomonas sp. PB120]|uniref:fatty acid oxidation complex subunit alpha FadB n=1 Tax=Pseudomonas sp. PB120 TaxID=2494700 RepID=UPI0012FDBB2D|nr:fatty acid oxidation complex subunit alpha FadB [Pseudomonas sp. PB120]MVV48869.1 fatty acid oxidation complex subunit alpha FadB [Pseudomonas sp. PB120]